MDQKFKMRAAKTVMAKNVKKLQLVLEEFKELDGLNLSDNNLHKVAVEVEECSSSSRQLYDTRPVSDSSFFRASRLHNE